MYDLVKRSNFILQKSLNGIGYQLLFCGELKDEKKAFLQLEKVILKHSKNTKSNIGKERRKD